MVTPDFDNLVVVAKYLSPIKEINVLKKKIISAIKADDRCWLQTSPHKRSLEFKYSLKKKLVERYGPKVSELPRDQFLEKSLLSQRMHFPCKIIVLISKTTKRGSTIETKCLPVLYRRITQIGMRYLEKKPVSIFDVKSCIFESGELNRRIFVGSLQCEELDPPHPLKPVEERFYEILFNTKEDKELTNKLLSELKKAKKEVRIAGWIGTYIIPSLKKLNKKGVKTRIITKSPSETTRGYRDKGEALDELKEFLRKDDLRFLRTGHFRLLIIDENSIFDGSMDMDSQSLAEREESAIWTNNPYIVAKAKIKFDELFKKGKHPKDWK